MRRRLVLLALLVAVAGGCDRHHLRPPGDGPTRYRDEVFSGVTTTPNVVYGSAVNQAGQTVTLRLDVYRPAGDTVTSRPAIVWVHGGGFSGGSRTSPEIVDEANVFARKGYVNVSISYRLYPGGCFPATFECLVAIRHAQYDAQAAVRFLRANAATYGVDPGRIAIAGTSAGAITALNVGFNSTDVGDSGNPGFSSRVAAAVSLSGAQLYGTADANAAASLLFHGTTDSVVPYQWAVDSQARADAAGLESYLTSWEGDGHVPYVEHRAQILEETTNFLFWTLDLNH